MTSAAGLRRLSNAESLHKGDDLPRTSSVPYIRRPSFQRQKSSNLLSANSWSCFPVFVTLITAAVLVARIGFSFLVLESAVIALSHHSESFGSENTSLVGRVGSIRRVSSSDRPLLITKDISYDGSLATRTTLHVTRTLAGKPGRSLNSSRDCIAGEDFQDLVARGSSRDVYHSPSIFYRDFEGMMCKFKIFVYPHSGKDRFRHIYSVYTTSPTGNYASEHYFKMALMNSGLITKDPSEADLFYMPFSIARMRNDPKIGVDGIKNFVRDYVSNISHKYSYWNRSGGADHFYVNCHSIGKTATYRATHVRTNAIQVVCSSSYHLQVYFPHKDATIPQIWPRSGSPKLASSIVQRKNLAFFAGAANSPVRAEVAKHWSNDTEIKVYTHRIKTPYDQALLSSRYCLHVRGFEVNTARLADAMHYGCVPIIIANYHDLPFNDVLDWRQFSLVVTTEDIPRLKQIIKAVEEKQYLEMQKNVMQVRQHFEWHDTPKPFDAFHMVMYELWLRRHVVRSSL